MYHKGGGAESACKVLYYEVCYVSITHFQSCKVQAKACRSHDEALKQELTNHANCSSKHKLKLIFQHKKLVTCSKL